MLEPLTGRIRRIDWHRTAIRPPVAVVLVLGLVAAVRLVPATDVIRQSTIVLSGNDPYAYRTAVEQVTAAASSPLDFRTLLTMSGSPERGEPLYVGTVAVITEFAGGSRAVAGWVLALYPVVTAVITGLLVYVTGSRVSGDRRVGLVAVALLAVAPGHVFRTSIGFADHHAFDYLWLATTVCALVMALTEVDGRLRWGYGLLIGVGVAGQALAWTAGPLLLVPFALSVALAGPLLVREREARRLLPVVGGLFVATVAVAIVQYSLGWHSQTTLLAVSLLWIGTAAVTAGSMLAERYQRQPSLVVGVEILGAGVVLTWVQFGEPTAEVSAGISRLFASYGIAEMTALGGAFGPVIGPTIMLGFTLVVGLPTLCWLWWRTYRRPQVGWTVLAVYTLVLLGLALIQRRFTGELAPFVAVIAAVGFVEVLAWLDLTSPVDLRRVTSDGGTDQGTQSLVVPDRRRFLATSGLFGVVLGFPAVHATELNSRLTVRDSMYRASRAIRRYASEHDRSWPQNYVFSQWGDNRFYNYFANGHARSYGYARNNYLSFLLSDDPEEWYQRLQDRCGFVVVDYLSSDLRASSMYERLYSTLGSRAGRVEGVEHFRAIYVDQHGGPRVYALVPGARIEGTAEPSESVSLSVTVSLPSTTFRYERRVSADASGHLQITVPYPGEYEIGSKSVTVTEATVLDGRTQSIGSVR